MSAPVITSDSKTAVILFNLGGPDSLKAVEPFLFNLFNDKAIISLPKIIRTPLAKFISKKRAKKTAIPIYELLGGKSPILENTEDQKNALEAALKSHGDVRCFICMRYWHPMSEEMVKQVKNYAPDHIILLPLYPQFSTTTTGSSVKDFKAQMKKQGLQASVHTVCCYPEAEGFVEAIAQKIKPYYEQACHHGRPKLILSAHGLPEKIIKKGDPYQWQVEQTSKAIVAALEKMWFGSIDWVTSYQSRVGPLEWIKPDTEQVIIEAAQKNQPIVLVPVAFVSEHSETLVELDIEYKHRAESYGLKHYYRVPTVAADSHYIGALKSICLNIKQNDSCQSNQGSRICPDGFSCCPCKK